MKSKFLVGLFCGSFLFFPVAAPAEELDDLMAAVRAGTDGSFTPDQRQAILAGPRQQALVEFRAGLTALYVWSVQASIVHPANHGGWPYRISTLTEPRDRKNLAQGVKEAFEAEPSGLLAYASLCPARYVGDEAWFEQARTYLQQNDTFLFALTEKELPNWQAFITKVLAGEEATRKAREAATPVK